MKTKACNVLCMLVLAMACAPATTQIEKTYPRSLVLVLCDLTTSIGSEQIEDVIINTEKVLKALPPNTRYSLNPIGQVPDMAFCDGETQADVPFEKILPKNRKVYDNCLTKLREEYDTRHKASCIIDAMHASANMIRDLHKKKIYEKITLVVISDMLEVCSVNGTYINLESNTFDAATTNRILKDWPENRRFLEGLDSVGIYVVFNSSKQVPYAPLHNFWNGLIKKAGYTNGAYLGTDFKPEFLQ